MRSQSGSSQVPKFFRSSRALMQVPCSGWPTLKGLHWGLSHGILAASLATFSSTKCSSGWPALEGMVVEAVGGSLVGLLQAQNLGWWGFSTKCSPGMAGVGGIVLGRRGRQPCGQQPWLPELQPGPGPPRLPRQLRVPPALPAWQVPGPAQRSHPHQEAAGKFHVMSLWCKWVGVHARQVQVPAQELGASAAYMPVWQRCSSVGIMACRRGASQEGAGCPVEHGPELGHSCEG